MVSAMYLHPVGEIISDVWTLVGAVVLFLLLVTAMLSLGASAYGSRIDSRLQDQRRSIRAELSARSDRADPEWNEWISGLSGIELRALGLEIDRRVRRECAELDSFNDLICAFWFGPVYPSDLSRTERLRVLRWFAHAGVSIDPERLTKGISDHPDERAAVARALLAGDHPRAQSFGTNLLLDSKSLSAYGLDSLYRLNASDSSLLFQLGCERSSDWNATKTEQILHVIAQCERTENPPLEWVIDCLDHDSSTVRLAAITVLDRYQSDAVDETERQRNNDRRPPVFQALSSTPAERREPEDESLMVDG